MLRPKTPGHDEKCRRPRGIRLIRAVSPSLLRGGRGGDRLERVVHLGVIVIKPAFEARFTLRAIK